MPQMRSTNSFEEEFQARLAGLEADAAELGETWTSICRGIGVSRATPDRWKAETPLTITLLDKMANYLSERRTSLVQRALTGSRSDPSG